VELRYFLEADRSAAPIPRTAAIKLARVYHRDRWRYSSRRVGLRVDRVPLDRPIFLLGSQGSGATIVGRCLRRNPSVVTVSGASDQWTGIDELGIVGNRMARLPRSLWGSSHRVDLANETFGANHTGVFASDSLLSDYRSTREDANIDDAAQFRRLIREHIAVYARDPRSARFLDKTHTYTVKLPLLAALLEGTSPVFILVVRNPYGAVPWTVERKPPSFRRSLPDEARLELAAQHWANAHRIALDDAADVGGLAVVRFEDFLARPDTVVEAVCEVAGLDFDAGMVPGPGQSRPWATLPTDRKWHPLYADDRLVRTTPAQRAVVEIYCSELAERFGYDPDGHSRRQDPVELVGRAPLPV
jgi:Sulfotransferase family